MDTVIDNRNELKDARQADGAREHVRPESAEDEAVMEMAKERLQAKRVLFRQGLDLALLALVLIFLIALDYAPERGLVAFAYGLYWFVRYMIRLVKFAQPSFRNGISAYMKRRGEMKLNTEYIRIKTLLEAQKTE